MATPRNPANARVATAFRLQPDLLDRLDEAAADRMMSRNKLVERMLEEAFAFLRPVAHVDGVLVTPTPGRDEGQADHV